MARLTGPDEKYRLVYLEDGRAKARGYQVPLFLDADCTQPAVDVLTLDGEPIPGAVVTVDRYSKIPLVQYPDGVRWLYTQVAGGPVVALGASETEQIAELAAQIGDVALPDGIMTGDANLADVADVVAARTNLGLGNAATRPVGTGAGTVAAGDDPRITGSVQKSANLSDLDNPAVARVYLGLSEVDNTSDAEKPVSAPTQTALNTKVAKGDLVVNVRDYGAVGNGSADDTAAIQAAITAAGTAKRLFFPDGTYRFSTPITLVSDVQSSSAAILSYVGTGRAVTVGSDVSGVILQNRRIEVPQIVYAPKVGVGWAAGNTGLYVVNLNRSELLIRRIRGFETGVLFYGKGQGCAYLTVQVGHLDNNKVNSVLGCDNLGWCNQITFLGGSWSHDSNEGLRAAGTKHILLADPPENTNNPPNNNTWVNASLESPGVVEYTIDVEGGSYNVWLNPRLEFSGDRSRIRWGAGAVRNWVLGGTHVDSVEETHAAGSFSNSVMGTTFTRLMPILPAGMILENGGSGTYAALTVLRAGGTGLGDDPTTQYTVRLQPNQVKAKRYNDAADRVLIDGQNGRVSLGTGAATPVVHWSSGTTSPEGSVTGSPGSVYSRNSTGTPPLYVKTSGTGTTGWMQVASIADAGVGNGQRDAVAVFAPLKKALAAGTQSVAVQVLGDSTGNDSDEWVALFAAHVAAAYPSWSVHRRLWNHTTQEYGAPFVVSTSSSGARYMDCSTGTLTRQLPATASTHLSGVIDVRVEATMADWTPATNTVFVGRSGGAGSRGWYLLVNTAGVPAVAYSTDGTTLVSRFGTAATGITDGSKSWLRALFTPDDGAGNHVVSFWKSTDGVTWTQIGATVTTAGALTLYNPTSVGYEIGGTVGGITPAQPLIHQVWISPGDTGPSVVPMLPEHWPRVGAASANIVGGPVLTIVNGSSPGAAISYLGDPVRLPKMAPPIFNQKLTVLSDSHNELNRTGQSWISLYEPWRAAVRALLPGSPILLMAQNPETSASTWYQEHNLRVQDLISYARAQRLPIIDVYTAFQAVSGWESSHMLDSVHPNTTGSALWANLVNAAFDAADPAL